MNLTGDELARACADHMWSTDYASKALGMKIEEIREGYARISMPVRDDMANGQGMCHGGMIFTLADSTFAFSCNGRNQNTVAQHCAITFLSPGRVGDTLVAISQERAKAGRSGIYDVTVSNTAGDIIAEFRGNSREVKGQPFPQNG